jgi:L,D-transpeptidase catalytic domain
VRKTLRPLVPGSLFLALVATCVAAVPAAPMIAPVPVALEAAPAAVAPAPAPELPEAVVEELPTAPAPAPATIAAEGLAPEVLAAALDAVSAARARGVSARTDLLTVIDYSLPSTEPRLWVLDVERGEVLYRELVAHGKGTGDNYATRFSNVPESRQTSLGLFLTAGTYTGGNGYSLKLRGLDQGLNDRAEERYIVMHGAWYVSPEQARAQGRIGRSWGCPAVSDAVAKPIIDTIKGGSFIYSYHPQLAAAGAATPAAVRAAR